MPSLITQTDLISPTFQALKETKDDLETKLREHIFQNSFTSPENAQGEYIKTKTTQNDSHKTEHTDTHIPDRRGSFPFFTKLCSPRPFNSPRLIRQLANPILVDWSPVSDINANNTPVIVDKLEKFRYENGSLGIDPINLLLSV